MSAREPDTEFAPLRTDGGYHPIGEHGLIGGGETAALVARDGTIDWLCVPRFDSSPLFGALLDVDRGGAFSIAPVGSVESRQRYEPDTGILVTELRTAEGHVRITDALLLRADADLTEETRSNRGELLRCAEVLHGRVDLRVALAPYGGGELERDRGGLRLHWPPAPEIPLYVAASRPLDGLETTCELAAGDRFDIALSWRGTPASPARRLLDETATAWRQWMASFEYAGPHEDLVRRSAITLKMLNHIDNGAIVAAPTTSLPERIGGSRNWDYRYTWIRDAAFTVFALRRIGYGFEADSFLRWVFEVCASDEAPRVVYDIDGRPPLPERVDEELVGYRGSAPVRFGNAAAEQRQHDVYGEIVDSAFQWARRGGVIHAETWEVLRPYVERARTVWNDAAHGIWEMRAPGRRFTYTAALCAVALERGARLAEEFDLPGDRAEWRRSADAITERILEQAWDPQRNALCGTLEGGPLDASVLALPLRRVVSANHPKMVATTETLGRELSPAKGLVYRYLVDETADGLPGDEGAFVLCSFWLIDNYTHQQRLDEAQELFDAVCSRTNHLGLLPEQIDPSNGAFLGNFPQALSHVGLISTAVELTRELALQGHGDEEAAIPVDEAFKTAAMEAPSPDRGGDADTPATH